MRHCLLALVCIVVALGSIRCTSDDTPTYEGKTVTLTYPDTARFTDGEWVRIDQHTFRHLRDRRQADSVDLSLPASEVLFDSTQGRGLRTRIQSRSMPLYLMKYIDLLNASDSLSAEYVIESRAMATLRGQLVLSRADSSTITVQTSEGYGAAIRTRP